MQPCILPSVINLELQWAWYSVCQPTLRNNPYEMRRTMAVYGLYNSMRELHVIDQHLGRSITSIPPEAIAPLTYEEEDYLSRPVDKMEDDWGYLNYEIGQLMHREGIGADEIDTEFAILNVPEEVEQAKMAILTKYAHRDDMMHCLTGVERNALAELTRIEDIAQFITYPEADRETRRPMMDMVTLGTGWGVNASRKLDRMDTLILEPVQVELAGNPQFQRLANVVIGKMFPGWSLDFSTWDRKDLTNSYPVPELQ